MPELRWILLVAAILILLALFVWGRYRPRLPKALPAAFRRQEPIVEPASIASPASAPAEAPAPPPAPTPKAELPLPTKIVTIRLVSKDRAGFSGETLVLALREAGLIHGQYGIFHKMTDDEQAPLFSVASLMEPGSFDLTRVKTDVYPGVSLFLGLPGPVDGVIAFDAMVEAARGICAALGGELLDEHGSTLSVQRERYLREEIIQFRHRQQRPA